MSNNYDPDILIYYGPKDSDHRILPAPDISVSLAYNYSNDTIIGYTYTISLTGYITALDLRTGSPSSNAGPGAVIDHIEKLKKILVQNGSILHVVDKSDNTILKAKGGILRSLNIENSTNNMVHYVPYTATLEFSSLDLAANTEDCANIFLDSSTYNADGIVDIAKFKIKSFNDSWSFTFDENDSFNRIKENDAAQNMDINNRSFNISYTISATGKHFFVYDNEETGSSKILPAWEQAKNFVQYRLHKQVTSLIDNVLKDSYNTACSSPDGQNDILEPGSAPGLFKNYDGKYKIFNEQITCETSESDGSFSATYSAIVKSQLGNTQWSTPETKHTVTKTITSAHRYPVVENIGPNDPKQRLADTNISLKGTIEGLIEGGLIRSPNPIILPSNGSILIGSGLSTKYSNAKLLLDKIYSDDDYNSGFGEFGKKDLKPAYKNILNITQNALGVTPSSADTIEDPPHPTSFTLTHDYNAGTINYTVEYSNRPCGRKFNDISIQTTNPTKISAAMNIPNSFSCPIIQELGTYTAKKVSITIQGVDSSDMGQPAEYDLVNGVINDLSIDCFSPGYLPIALPPDGNYIITEKKYTKNPIDGSFTVNLSYICNTVGCSI